MTRRFIFVVLCLATAPARMSGQPRRKFPDRVPSPEPRVARCWLPFPLQMPSPNPKRIVPAQFTTLRTGWLSVKLRQFARTLVVKFRRDNRGLSEAR